ncbi:DUF58 domain-containing protein [Aquibacillus rhizosphaerae]|uniref:DUF58 domain-containing protein n=1 Tax=Aquibacillus rhizosphaerae TaxID=3051431 RepID=A0ABT7L9Y3_9BACI|nr:DUF58 domain-containing protein [Aquibacillus sp. LR5S19]MDL4842000.1 DUF58 domain-containing protein [Aquibacillus sp. LR5S19]
MKGEVGLAVKLLQITLLFAIFFSYAMFQGGFVSWFLFYSFLPILLYMFLLLLYPVSKWEVSREMSKHLVRAGDKVTVTIEMERKVAFPIYYLVVEEFFPASLQYKDSSRDKFRYMDEPNKVIDKRNVKKLLFPWFKRRLTVTYTLDNIPRGEHHLKAIRIKTGDFFGFIKKNHVFEVTSHLLAHPSQRQVLIKEKVSSFDEGSSPAHELHLNNSNMVTGVREYAPGDRFSWIDWKTTARKDTVMTKEFEQEKSSNLLLVLDATDYEGLNKIAFEARVELTASVLKSLKRQASQLALLSLGEKHVYFPFNQDPSKNELMQTFLAKVQPQGEVPFPQQLMYHSKQLPQGLITMVITSYLDQDMVQSLSQLKQKSKRVILFIIKPISKVNAQDNNYIRQLSSNGVVVNIMAEKQLIKAEFEVSM